MQTALLIVQIILGVALITTIILQPQGTGLGVTWSGGGETYHTRRGLEKVIFISTIVLTVLFASNALAIILL